MTKSTDLTVLLANKPKEIKSAGAKATTEVTIDKTEYIDGEKVPTQKVLKSEQTEVARVAVEDEGLIHISMDMGATISLGNYNMGKVGVSIHLPVGKKVTPEVQKEIDESYEFARSYCEAKMKIEVGELLKMKGTL
jgi:hypothetical protein